MESRIKILKRVAAGTVLAVIFYTGGRKLIQSAEAFLPASSEEIETEAPYVILKDGTVASPDMITTMKYDKDTFIDTVRLLFGDAEEPPDYDDFLSRFTCNGCHKNCLLLTPSCANGRGKQKQATVVYQEFYPEMEITL